MKSAEKTVSPVAVGVMALCAGAAFLVSVALMPAAELVQAQVQPARRMSGESPVRIFDVMKVYADVAAKSVTALASLRPPVVAKDEQKGNPNPPAVVLPENFQQWESHVVETLKDKDTKDVAKQTVQGQEYVSEMKKSVGDNELQKLVDLYLKDPNYPYYAYGLFLGLAMFFASIAILAIGRYEAEEVTVIPVKK